MDSLHGLHHLLHHRAALAGHLGGVTRQLAGLAGTVGILLHGRSQLFHGSGSLLQGAGLLFGALAQVRIALGDLGAGRGHALRIAAHAADYHAQLRRHGLHRHEQTRHFITALDLDMLGQVTGRYRLGQAHRFRQRTGGGTGDGDHQPQRGHGQHRQRSTQHDQFIAQARDLGLQLVTHHVEGRRHQHELGIDDARHGGHPLRCRHGQLIGAHDGTVGHFEGFVGSSDGCCTGAFHLGRQGVATRSQRQRTAGAFIAAAGTVGQVFQAGAFFRIGLAASQHHGTARTGLTQCFGQLRQFGHDRALHVEQRSLRFQRQAGTVGHVVQQIELALDQLRMLHIALRAIDGLAGDTLRECTPVGIEAIERIGEGLVFQRLEAAAHTVEGGIDFLLALCAAGGCAITIGQIQGRQTAMLLHLLEQQQQLPSGCKGQRFTLGSGEVVEIAAHQEGGRHDE